MDILEYLSLYQICQTYNLCSHGTLNQKTVHELCKGNCLVYHVLLLSFSWAVLALFRMLEMTTLDS